MENGVQNSVEESMPTCRGLTRTHFTRVHKRRSFSTEAVLTFKFKVTLCSTSSLHKLKMSVSLPSEEMPTPELQKPGRFYADQRLYDKPIQRITCVCAKYHRCGYKRKFTVNPIESKLDKPEGPSGRRSSQVSVV